MFQQKKKFPIIITILFLLTLLLPFRTQLIANAKTTVHLNETSLKLAKDQGKTLKLIGTTKKVTWSSSNKAVAVVNDKGYVYTKGSGTATITAKVGTKSYKCKVTVPALKYKYKITIKNKTTGTTKDKKKEFTYIVTHYNNGKSGINFYPSALPNNLTKLTMTRCNSCGRCYLNNQTWQASQLEAKKKQDKATTTEEKKKYCMHNWYLITYGNYAFTLKDGEEVTLHLLSDTINPDIVSVYQVYDSTVEKQAYSLYREINNGSRVAIKPFDIYNTKGLDDCLKGRVIKKNTTFTFINKKKTK